MWIQKLNMSVTGLAYSPNGKTLYSLDLGGRLRSWDIASRKGRVLEHSGAVQDPEPYGRSLCALADGELVVVFAYSLCVIGATTRAFQLHWVPPDFPRYGRTLVTQDGRLLAVRDDKRAIITWDILNWQPGPLLREWPPRLGLIEFDLSPDGQTLAILERRRHASIINLASGETRCRFWPGVEKMASCPLMLSRDGNTLVVHAKTGMDVWDVSSSATRVAQLTSALPHMALAIHPTAPMCASMNRKRALTLFDLRTGEPIRSFDLSLGKELMCVTFSPDGLTCAAGGSNGRFAVFDVMCREEASHVDLQSRRSGSGAGIFASQPHA
ncbi:MAG: WD40 repeat domain-containing protein [Planctomycetia bacterium]|nr:WD40 repeat domain-containing protein [Planctomycetia bacterium]